MQKRRCLRAGQSRCTALIAEPAGYRSLCRIMTRLHAAGNAALPPLLVAEGAGLGVLVDDEVMLKALHEPLRGRLWLDLERPAPPGRRERDLLDDAKRVGVRPVASVAAHFAAPAGHAGFRLLAAVKKGVPLAALPPGVVAPAHHLADPREAAERFRDVARQSGDRR
jgi:hypothetical protein